ncbi:hypothetical protein NFI96_032233, partial [Prochilodus magdalenae]
MGGGLELYPGSYWYTELGISHTLNPLWCWECVCPSVWTVDMWRDSQTTCEAEYTWVKVFRDQNLVQPPGWTDHHLISVDFITPSTQREGSYWKFDLRLLQDEGFSVLFRTFWEEWRLRKAEFKSLVSWWEVGKTQIRVFSQQYRAHSADMVSDTLCGLEAEVRLLERELVDSGNIGVSGQLDRRRKALSSFLHEHSKAALTRHRFSTINDMDSPSAFFFNLPKTARPQNRMLHLRSADGRVTTVPGEMRTLATDFYKDLYDAVECDPSCRDELLCDLPRITGEQVDLLEAVLELQELTTAVQEQTSGRAPGINGLPAEFYKQGTIGEDLFAVFKCCFSERWLPVSSSRAVLSLLPKAGDLGLLKNWMHSIVHDNQTYCIPHHTIMDNLFLVRDVIDLCGMDSLDIGLLTLDQEKAFDIVDHVYLFKTLQAFGFKSGFISWLSILYSEASFLLKWGREGLKYLGVFLGTPLFQKKNWDGVVEKVCAKLSKWTWVLPQLSYRGRVLVANNLVASMLWHCLAVLEPPVSLIKDIQMRIVTFFWSGQHWIPAPALYLPLQEGGQALIDLSSRVKAFRLQTVQRLIHGKCRAWVDTACVLLRRVEGLDCDKHLFVLRLDEMNLSATSPFYQSVLRAWSAVLCVRRVDEPLTLVEEEPLFFNHLISSQTLGSRYIRQCLQQAGITTVGVLRLNATWKTADDLCVETGVLSSRLMERLLGEVVAALSSPFREILGRGSIGDQLPHPSLPISAAATEAEGSLLTFRTPMLTSLEAATKKALYVTCVKVGYHKTLSRVKELRWSGVLAPGSSPRGSWRSLYKPPIEKRTADLQWRIVHGAVATNRGDCVFCGGEETTEHLLLRCPRLRDMFSLLRTWFGGLGVRLTES